MPENSELVQPRPRIAPLLSALSAFTGSPNEAQESANFKDQTIEGNFSQIEEFMAPLHGVDRSIRTFARLFGGIYAEVDLSPVADVEINHSLAVTPRYILLSVDANGTGGIVQGHPSNGLTNTGQWTPSSIFLRATISSSYVVVVI